MKFKRNSSVLVATILVLFCAVGLAKQRDDGLVSENEKYKSEFLRICV